MGDVNKHKTQFRTSNYQLVLCPKGNSDPAHAENMYSIMQHAVWPLLFLYEGLIC